VNPHNVFRKTFHRVPSRQNDSTIFARWHVAGGEREPTHACASQHPQPLRCSRLRDAPRRGRRRCHDTFAVGRRDRIAALVLWCNFCLFSWAQSADAQSEPSVHRLDVARARDIAERAIWSVPRARSRSGRQRWCRSKPSRSCLAVFGASTTPSGSTPVQRCNRSEKLLHQGRSLVRCDATPPKPPCWGTFPTMVA